MIVRLVRECHLSFMIFIHLLSRCRQTNPWVKPFRLDALFCLIVSRRCNSPRSKSHSRIASHVRLSWALSTFVSRFSESLKWVHSKPKLVKVNESRVNSAHGETTCDGVCGVKNGCWAPSCHTYAPKPTPSFHCSPRATRGWKCFLFGVVKRTPNVGHNEHITLLPRPLLPTKDEIYGWALAGVASFIVPPHNLRHFLAIIWIVCSQWWLQVERMMCENMYFKGKSDRVTTKGRNIYMCICVRFCLQT